MQPTSPREKTDQPQKPYASRGGGKLEAALRHFNLGVDGITALDVGASTGGFTDCLLKRGARKVYALDVGYGQFDWRLRNDPRVVVIERTNIRHWDGAELTEPLDLAVIDVSFISLTLVFPKVVEVLGQKKQEFSILALIKPNFEVGRGQVGPGGVVRDPALHHTAIEKIRKSAESLSLRFGGTVPSPLLGPKGNREFFILLHRSL